MKSEDPYDLLAQQYQEISGQREKYLSGVNNFILKNIFTPPIRILDIGCADGNRSEYLRQQTNAKELVLLDSSEEMIKICKSKYSHRTIQKKIHEIDQYDGKFSHIFMLWNVLGHTKNEVERLESLKAIASVMDSNASLFFDVNNLLNGNRYGYLRMLKNLLLEMISSNPLRGDTNIQWNVSGKVIPAQGHLFTPREVRRIVENAGLSIARIKFVNYETGKEHKYFFRGQMAIECKLKS